MQIRPKRTAAVGMCATPTHNLLPFKLPKSRKIRVNINEVVIFSLFNSSEIHEITTCGDSEFGTAVGMPNFVTEKAFVDMTQKAQNYFKRYCFEAIIVRPSPMDEKKDFNTA
jgi:hypothetical protein